MAVTSAMSTSPVREGSHPGPKQQSPLRAFLFLGWAGALANRMPAYLGAALFSILAQRRNQAVNVTAPPSRGPRA